MKRLKICSNRKFFSKFYVLDGEYTIKSRTAILRRITGYEEVLELWLGMSLNYYYLTSKDYLAIILDNPYGKIKEAALI